MFYLVEYRLAFDRRPMRRSFVAAVAFVVVMKCLTFVVAFAVSVGGQPQLLMDHRGVADPWPAIHRKTVAAAENLHLVGVRVGSSMEL